VGDHVATYATKYEPLRGYLHSTSLRWSYGATKGRPSDWSAQLAAQPLSYVVAAVAASGFDGLWVDPAGFEPAKAGQIERALRAQLHQAPLTSRDGDLWFFDLRPYEARLAQTHPRAQLAALRTRTLHPLRSACTAPSRMLTPGLTGPPCRR
jgi:phosphoglycerol transferase